MLPRTRPQRLSSAFPPLPSSPYPPPRRRGRSFTAVTHFTGLEHKAHLAANALVLGVLLLAKIPEMHGVRIFRINKSTTETE